MGNPTLKSEQNEPSSLKYNGPTPGPWDEASQELEGTADVGLLVIAGDEVVCSFFEHMGSNFACFDNDKANAQLICAAPDLLAALQMLHDDIAEYASINNLGGFDNHAMRMARAAIAKAIGDA